VAPDVLEQLAQPRLSALRVGGITVPISHPERVYWPATRESPPVTKRDLLRYLACAAPVLLPHLKNRPLTLRRYPYGLSGKHFYQKHVDFQLPDFVQREQLFAEEHGEAGDHVFCNDLPTLLWLGQIANLELHPWYSRRVGEPDATHLPHTFDESIEALEASVLNYPEFMVFDLDSYVYSGHEATRREPEPHEAGFRAVCRAARWLKNLLDQLGLPAYVKTSGKTGLHIFVPILRQFDYDTVREMCGQICRFLLRLHPAELTMEWSTDKRRGKVFLDHNQNTRGKTLASAYSPRTLPTATVSMPVRWDELEQVYPGDFTVRTAHARIQPVGDLWADILEHKVDLGTLEFAT
jgi:bifunctional non-homologous end joining protein LigD